MAQSRLRTGNNEYGRVSELALVTAFILILMPHQVLAENALLDKVSVSGNNNIEETIQKPYTLTIDGRKFTVPAKTLKTLVKISQEGDTKYLKLSPGRIYDFLNIYVSPVINEPAENAKFILRDGKFELKAAAKKGKIVDGIKTSLGIRSALVEGRNTSKIYMKRHEPEITNIAEFNKLGKLQLIAKGSSNFAGSPGNRIKNIMNGRLKIQGALLAPGEEFSINKHLGPITKEAGYFPELVIKENVTKPEYGGGLCQVSTTLFRAAVNAGLEITERRNHAYPVKYYGKPGFDATIYSPRPDLKFKNTTGGWILLQSSVNGNNLSFEVYGKPDGRKIKIDGPHTTEKRPDGSIRTLLRQTVLDKNGKTISDKLFKSEYKSPDLFPITRKENGE